MALPASASEPSAPTGSSHESQTPQRSRAGAPPRSIRSLPIDPASPCESCSDASEYEKIIHSIAVLVARDNPVAAGLFTAGISLFSGSIYALVLDPARFKFLGPVTPLGGLCLIGGWLALAFGKAPSVAAGELRL